MEILLSSVENCQHHLKLCYNNNDITLRLIRVSLRIYSSTQAKYIKRFSKRKYFEQKLEQKFKITAFTVNFMQSQKCRLLFIFNERRQLPDLSDCTYEQTKRWSFHFSRTRKTMQITLNTFTSTCGTLKAGKQVVTKVSSIFRKYKVGRESL